MSKRAACGRGLRPNTSSKLLIFNQDKRQKLRHDVLINNNNVHLDQQVISQEIKDNVVDIIPPAAGTDKLSNKTIDYDNNEDMEENVVDIVANDEVEEVGNSMETDEICSEDRTYDEDDMVDDSGDENDKYNVDIYAGANQKKVQNLSGVMNFDVYKEILAEVLKIQEPLPKDDKMNLYESQDFQAECNITKGMMARRLNTVFKTHNLTAIAALDILEVLQDSFPQLNLPVKINAHENYRSELDNYVLGERCLLKFDACKSGCMVFVGDDYNQIACSKCKLYRFRFCSISKCQGKPYEDCTHSQSLRVPIHVVYYRPILPLIIDLIQTKGFLIALNLCHYKDANDSILIYGDILTGKVAKENLEEMEQKFLNFRNKYPEKSPVRVNIVISQFYDGAQIFKHQYTKFWPIMMSILNLPPTFRTVVGVGIFLVALFTGNLKSAAEEFLLDNCFVAELNSLYIGQEVNIKGVTYFIQVRLILHLLDTRAVEHVMKVQATGSYAKCPLCSLTNGSKKKEVGSVIWDSHRRLLPMNHYLRGCGQSGTCCPSGYTIDAPGSFVAIPDTTDHSAKTIKTHLRGAQTGGEKLRKMKPCLPGVVLQPIIDLWRHNIWEGAKVSGPLWYNVEFPAELFQKHLYNHHYDFRPFKPYQRVSTEVFTLYGDDVNPDPKKIVTGVTGQTAYRNLFNFDIRKHLNWEGFHVLANGGKKTLLMLKRMIASDMKDLKYCQQVNSHPSLNGGINPLKQKKSTTINGSAWGIDGSTQNKIDCWLECVNVPTGYAGDLCVHNIFSHTGDLTGKPAIDCITILMDYILLCFPTNYPIAYKSYLRLISLLYTKLLAEEFDEEGIENLYNRICEFVALNNTIFPLSMSHITFHQLIDLPHYIKMFGSLRNWWTYAGERSLAALKLHRQRGGQNFSMTILERYLASEMTKAQKYYDFDLADLAEKGSKFPCLSDRYYNFNKDFMSFDDRKCKLFKEIVNWNNEKLDWYEHNHLCVAIVHEIIKCCESEEDALDRSFVYRLYKYYTLICDKGDVKNEVTFLDFLVSLTSDLNSNVVLDYSIIKEGDILKAKTLTNLTVMSTFNKAYVHGIKLTARGQEHRETAEPRNENQNSYGRDFKQVSNNVSNKLKANWHISRQYSSWCKFRSKINKKRFGDSERKYKDHYGQLNYFISIEIPDEVIPKIAFGSITCRKAEVLPGSNIHRVMFDDYISFDGNIMFVPLADLYSTAVAVVGFEKQINNKGLKIAIPILISQRDSIHKTNAKFITAFRHNGDHLLLIDIHRERLSLKFTLKHNFEHG